MCIHGPRCAIGIRPKLICDFGIATIGQKKRDFPSRVLSTCGTGEDGNALLVIGKFSTASKPTRIGSTLLRKFSLGTSPKVPSKRAPTCYKCRRKFGHSGTKLRANSKLKMDSSILRKELVTNGAHSCMFIRNGTVRHTKHCSFISYDSRALRDKDASLARCSVISLVYNTSTGAFSTSVQRTLTDCYHRKNYLLIDNSG